MTAQTTLTLEMEVQHQKIYYVERSQVISGSRNYLYIRFDFTDDWQGTKHALFWLPDVNAQPFAVKVINNGCYVPNEVIRPPYFRVSLYCTNGAKLITTEPKMVRVAETAYTEQPDDYPDEPLGVSYVYTPDDDTRIAQIRTVEGVPEYSADGEIWKPIQGDITAKIGTF